MKSTLVILEMLILVIPVFYLIVQLKCIQLSSLHKEFRDVDVHRTGMTFITKCYKRTKEMSMANGQSKISVYKWYSLFGKCYLNQYHTLE
jgi:hypothetical protein